MGDLSENHSYIQDTILYMMNYLWTERPSCTELFSTLKNDYYKSVTAFLKEINLNLPSSYEIGELKFFKKFIQFKTKKTRTNILLNDLVKN